MHSSVFPISSKYLCKSGQILIYSLLRNISTNTTLDKYVEGKIGRIFYEPSKKGRHKAKDTKSRLENFKIGFRQIKPEIKKLKEEVKENITSDPIFIVPGSTDKVFQFKTEEDIAQWKLGCDSDHSEGYSKAFLDLSQCGNYATFHGHLDTTMIDDGISSRTGYCNMTIIPPTKSFLRTKSYDWMGYTHLVLRIRGDGRRYMIVFDTSGSFDVTWFDLHTNVLYTRGGPYWQIAKIPFSKFFMSAKANIQDKQQAMTMNAMKRIGITLMDDITGPFKLDIDYIGLHYDPSHMEKFAYEMYRLPFSLT